MTNLLTFAQQYNNADATLPERLALGEIEKVNIIKDKRTVKFTVRFTEFIDASELSTFEDILKNTKLNLERAEIIPSFPESSFSQERFPFISKELIKRIPSVSAIVDGATATYSDNILKIEIFHGGEMMLHSLGADLEIKRIISSYFGVTCNVEFTGVTEVTTEDEAFKESMKKHEETMKRKALEDFMEAELNYVSPEAKVPQTMEVREGAHLYPALYPGSQKPLWGRVFKSKTQPINTLSYDSGKVTVWGDIFNMETKVTKSGDKNIISLYITDYTSSVTLKIFAPIA